MPILQQIVSGGQTGADRAALDTAIKFNIPHGGWLPRGRKTESGPLDPLYQLKEMATADYPARTRQNILDSSGTLIISRGALSGGSKLTLSFANVTGRPNCCVDLLTHDIFEAALIVQSFILENQIGILNVAGPRASHDPAIYHDVRSILEAALYLFFLESDFQTKYPAAYPNLPAADPLPESLSQALDIMEADLALKEKAWIARLPESLMPGVYFSWLDPVKLRLKLEEADSTLMSELAQNSLWETYSPEDGVMDILKALKERLSKTYELRVLP